MRKTLAAVAVVAMLAAGCATDDSDLVTALEERLVELEGDLAEVTAERDELADLMRAMADAEADEPEPEPEPEPAGLAMYGDFHVKWDYGRGFLDLADRHEDCDEIGAYYTVQIQDRSGEPLADADLDDGWLGRDDKNTMVWINCEFVWSATVEPGDLDEYAVVVIEKGGNAIERQVRPANMLDSGMNFTNVSKRWR
jgi:hypothetical protein